MHVKYNYVTSVNILVKLESDLTLLKLLLETKFVQGQAMQSKITVWCKLHTMTKILDYCTMSLIIPVKISGHKHNIILLIDLKGLAYYVGQSIFHKK